MIRNRFTRFFFQLRVLALTANLVLSFTQGKAKQLVAPLISPRVNLSTFLKKELTRLRLRKRGSFVESTFISLFMRPMLEKGWVRNFFGAQLAFAVVIVGSQTNINQALNNQLLNQRDPHQVLELQLSNVQTLETDLHYLNPVASLIGVSQYFQTGHPGLDMRAPLGSDVIAIDQGVVSEVYWLNTGYGHHVFIQHENNVHSMYAHLGEVAVKPGDKVFSGQKLGEIGLTGWSTGPHLHFEMTNNGAKINPLLYLKPALEQWRTSMNH